MSKTNPSVKSHSTYYKNIQALHILTDLARPKLLTNPKYDQIRSKRKGKGCTKTHYSISYSFHLRKYIFVNISRDISVFPTNKVSGDMR